jgi:hypothetical protein
MRNPGWNGPFLFKWEAAPGAWRNMMVYFNTAEIRTSTWSSG